MKIVSDFDGVLTDLTEEGHRVREIFQETWARLSGDERLVNHWMTRSEEAMASSPDRYGWVIHGRISAYCDEDLFIANQGMGYCLDQWVYQGEPELVRALAALKSKGVGSFDDLANQSYGAMAAETKAGAIRPMDPAAVRTLSELVSRGHDVVIVSNSSTQRILEILKDSGVDVRDHERDPTAKFRVRGDARKFELSREARGLQMNGRTVDVSRPNYERLLLEEKPDAVIGDVFSLDLALPGFLDTGTHLVLRERGYTPEWSKALVRRQPKRTLLGHFSELPAALGLA